MHTEAASLTRPPITLIDNEAESLYDLALAARGKSKQAAELLLQEVDRADTFAREDLPADVVTMMSSVVFVDESTGEEHKVQLVWPKDADSANDRISVLTPIGAALIGMPRGASIDWPNRSGELRRLRIIDVIQPAAAA